MTLIWPYGYMLPIIFRSSGDAKFPMIVSIISMVICRILFSYILAVIFNMGMMEPGMQCFSIGLLRQLYILIII